MKILILFCLLNLFLTSTVTEIELNKQMDINENIFHLNYTKQTEKSVILILFYENVGKCEISVNNKNYFVDTYNETDSGFIYFACDENEYEIQFLLNEDLKETTLPPTFKLVSSEFEFSLDINKKIALTGINVDAKSEPCSIVFSFENFANKTYTKILEKFFPQDKFIFISENEGDYKLVRSNLLYFKKDINYKIKLDFSDNYSKYNLNNFIMDDINSDSIEIANVTFGRNILKPNIKYFYKINSKEYDLVVKVLDIYIYKYLATCQNEIDFNTFPYNAQYLSFNEYYNDIIEKQEGIDYLILLIEFKNENEIESFFTTPNTIELNEEKEFNETNSFFKLNYEKKSNISEMLYIFFEKDNYEKILIEIKSKEPDSSLFTLENVNLDTINYRIDNSSEYYIFFCLMSNYKVSIKIASSEYEFELDINREIFFYNFSSFEENTNFNTQIKFSIANTNKDYHKFFSSENLDKVISYNKNNTEFVPMTNPLFLFEKGELIRFIIYTKNIPNIARISNFEKYFITELNYGSYKYEIPTDKIFKIDYFKTPYFKLEGLEYYNYHIAYVTEEQYKNFDNNYLEQLSYKSYNNNSFSKPDKFYYAILIGEFYINGTLNIEQIENPINSFNFNSEEIFNSFKTNYQFTIPESESNKTLLFIYKANEEFSLKIDGPNNYEKNKTFEKKDETEGFALEKCEIGAYNFTFSSKNRFEGKFSIVKLSQEFNMDINDKIKLNSFSLDYKPEPLLIIFNTENLKEDEVYKKLTIGEKNELLNLIKIGHGGEDIYKNLNLNYYAFQKKEKEYKLKIDFKDLGNNQYEFSQFSIDDFNNYKYNDFISGVQKYNGPIIQFMEIDFEKTPKIKINIIKDNNLTIKIAYHNDKVDFKSILNDLVFEDLKDKLKDNFILSNNYRNATLMLELKPGSEINFIDAKKKDDKKDGISLVLILAIAIPVGIILILIIILLVCRHSKRHNEIDISQGETKDKEMLMPQAE